MLCGLASLAACAGTQLWSRVWDSIHVLTTALQGTVLMEAEAHLHVRTLFACLHAVQGGHVFRLAFLASDRWPTDLV